MTGGKGKRKTSEDALKALNQEQQLHPDGSLEDQVDVAIGAATRATIELQNLHDEVHALRHEIDISRTHNIVAMDLLCLMGLPQQAFDIAYENILVFNEKPQADPYSHIASRQAALRRKLEKAGVELNV